LKEDKGPLGETKRLILAVLNIFLLIVLCFLSFTNYSLRGFWPDQVFPIFVGGFGIFSIYKFRRWKSSKEVKRPYLVILPSMIAGILALIPFFCPLTWFFYSSYTDAELISTQVSTSGRYTAESYFKEVGFVDADDLLQIKIIDKYLPIIERDVYDDFYNNCLYESDACIRWIDNQHFEVLDTNEIVNHKQLKFTLPFSIAALVILFSFVFAVI